MSPFVITNSIDQEKSSARSMDASRVVGGGACSATRIAHAQIIMYIVSGDVIRQEEYCDEIL